MEQPKRTFYRRPLPDTCVALSSPEGQAHFASALTNQGCHTFFPLIENFSTQSEPAYCGISTLVIVLNALAVDPRKTWKGPWRWYEESMLNCCLDLEKVKETGITINSFRCLALCQGLQTKTTLVDDLLNAHSGSGQKDLAVEEFRLAVKTACVTPQKSSANHERQEILVVSYSRKVLGQTGSGHFSPVAAFDPVSDSVLILDTARFKYGAHWVSLPVLFDAMIPVDPDTQRSRGFLLLSDHDHGFHDESSLMPSILFRSQRKQNPVRRDYKKYLSQIEGNVTLDQVISFWTQNESKPSYIWNLMEPQFTPLDDNGDKDTINNLIESVRSLITKLIAKVPHTSFPKSCCECRVNYSRTLNLTSQETIFVVYLASIEESLRHQIILSADESCDDISAAQAQLQAEAQLVQTAIEMSDETDEL